MSEKKSKETFDEEVKTDDSNIEEQEQVVENVDDGDADSDFTSEDADASEDDSQECDDNDDLCAQLKAENSELKNQYLRKSADFENYRKRMLKEKQDTSRYANVELLKDLIEVVDNFERAIKAADDSADFDSFKEGISIIEQQFAGMLINKWGLKKIESDGEAFDANFHEAMMMEESGEYEVDTVAEVFQNGYMLHDRVLRPAKVKVAKATSTE